MKTLIIFVMNAFFVCNLVIADRTLSVGEIYTILNGLTQQPIQTWLPAGTIQARHLEYYKAEKSVYESNETMRFDGSRFYWEIVLNSAGNEEEKPFGKRKGPADANVMDLNRERIFCWDGNTYTQYYKSSHSAVVESMTTQAPLGTYGPFGAGIVPWGYGVFTLQHLSECASDAREVWVDGKKQIHLQITDEKSSPVLQMTFVLDPDKNHAIISCLLQDPQISGIEQKYDQYIQVNNRWLPTVITIERFLKTPKGREAVSYEDWKFESVSPEVPDTASFSVKLKNGTLVEFHPSNKLKSLMYYANDQKNMKSLLEEKIAFSAQQDSVGKNCAAAAVQIVTKQFARPFSAERIETLVTQNNKMTSLYLLKETLEESGLYCVAMETNLESLRGLKNSQAILHLSDSNHYVILDHIDDTDVWTIDLTSRKVYWKTPIQQFLQEWKHGTALVVSDNLQDLTTEVNGMPLSPVVQQQIMGGDPVAAGYSCTELLQVDDYFFCSKPVGILCGGRYYRYAERYGCREDPNGGTCTGQGMIGHDYTHCITDFYHFGACTITGVWYPRYIRACQ